MHDIWLVIKHEISTTFRKKSFWILTFLMPAALLLMNTYYIFQDSDVSAGESEAESEEGGEAEAAPELPRVGLVDEAGIIAEVPAEIPAGIIMPFADRSTAQAALEAGELDQFILVPPDFMDEGEITVFDREFQIFESGENMGVSFRGQYEWLLDFLISYNLTGNGQMATILRNPTPGSLAEYHRIAPEPQGEDAADQTLARVVAQAIPYIYYFILIISSGYMLQSVTAEKENRTVEVLLLSLRPQQLMIGKILGLTVIVLLQVAIWLGGGMLTIGRGAQLFNLSQYTFPPGFFVWAVLFLVLGYLLYASAMAAAGAVANTAREGNQMTFILIIPLMPTLMFGQMFAESPHSGLALALSLFPFSAPSAMVTRMAVAEVPLWQLLVSLVGVALTAYLMVTLAGRFFRPHNLLSTAEFNWRRFARAWRA